MSLPTSREQTFAAGSKIPSNVLNAIQDAIIAQDPIIGLNRILFGDGSDGDYTVSGTQYMVRDMYFNTLTVPNGAVLKPQGFRIYVKRTLMIASGGIIDASGLDGAVGGSSVGGIGGVAAPSGTVGG